ncbi:MAG: heavy metal translocating P-type ATPase [Chloroflexota bacterium]
MNTTITDATVRGTEIEVPFPPSFANTRQQQLKEISATGEVELSDKEKKNAQNVAIAVSSLAFTIAGTSYPLLGLLSVPGLIYLSLEVVRYCYDYIFKEQKAGMGLMDLISIGGTLVTGHLFAAAFHQTLYFFREKLILKTEDQTNKNLLNVFGQQLRFVWIFSDDTEIEVPFETLKQDNIVVVSAGEMIPIDGCITSGVATIDQRMFTGESQPVEKGVGEEVFATTILLSGKIHVKVEKAGEETLAAQIGDILNHTADFKQSVLSRGEAVANKWSWPTLGFSSLAFFLLNPTSAIAVCNVGFGCPMKIAAPLGVLNYFQIASRNGILIKDGRSLELLSQVDTVVFDKTGTLTEEQPHVGQIYTCIDISADELLTYAAATEQKQTHPIALAILQEAKKRGLTLPTVDEAQVEMGYGLTVRIAERVINIGSSRFMEMTETTIPTNISEIQQDCHEQGYSLVYVAMDGQLVGAIELHPTIRPEAKQIIGALRKRNFSLYIISGDHETPTKNLATVLGIDHYFAETLPENKADLIAGLLAEGKSVCFVGDGINDSIALKKATVSVSMCGASTVATDAASIVLMDGSLKQFNTLFDLAYDLDKNLSNSTTISFIPGLIGIGGVFFLHWGILSTVILYNVGVVASLINAMMPLLRHHRLLPDAPPLSSPLNRTIDSKSYPRILSRVKRTRRRPRGFPRIRQPRLCTILTAQA